MPLDIFVGHKFGMLTVLSFEQRQGKKQKLWYANCRCDCGTEKLILWPNIVRGSSTSCGCQKYANSAASRRKNNANWLMLRGEEIAAFYEDNPHLSIREVGQNFGVTYQRVQQAVAHYTPSDKSIKELQAERKQRVAQMLEERKELLIEIEQLRAQLQTNS